MMLKANSRLITSAIDADVIAYKNRIVAAGSSISVSTLQAIATFVRILKQNNIWDKFLEIAPYAGNNLNAALVKLKYPSGIQSTLTNVGFTTLDYSEATGLSGDNSGTKYLKTGFFPNAQLATSLDMHLSVYARNTSGLTGVSGTTTVHYIGTRSSSVNNFSIYRSAGNIVAILGINSDFVINTSGNIRPGLLMASNISANNGYLFYNGNLIGTETNFSTNALSTVESVIFGRNDANIINQISNLICGFHSFGYGLTPAQSIIAYNAVQALQTSLGRQI